MPDIDKDCGQAEDCNQSAESIKPIESIHSIYSAEDLEAMRNVDIRTVDPSTLVDIKDVKIDTNLPKNERILDFIRQIKNPYCYKCGKTIVKTTFSNTERTFEEIFKSILTDT